MRRIVDYLIDRIEGKTPKGVLRDPGWPELRKKVLAKQPYCSVCGKTKRLQVHHIIPFFLDRSKEMDPENLIVLCARKKVLNCHLVFGHLGSFRNFNFNVQADAAAWSLKLRE